MRERLHAFNERGVDGLGIKPGAGRKPRLTQLERSTILALVKLPPGKPTYELTGELTAPDPEAESYWTLDMLTAAAQQQGIQAAGGQVRRIFRREGVRWRRTQMWATSTDPDFAPNGPGSSRAPAHEPQLSGATLFPPGEPLRPVAGLVPPDGAPRQWPYPVGYNIAQRPRATELTSFAQLRNLAAHYDGVQFCMHALRRAHNSRAEILLARSRQRICRAYGTPLPRTRAGAHLHTMHTVLSGRMPARCCEWHHMASASLSTWFTRRRPQR